MSSSPPESRLVRVVLAVVAVFVLGYSVLVVTEPLLGVVIVLVLFALVLAWRFVYAFERIAGALETIADDQADGADRTDAD